MEKLEHHFPAPALRTLDRCSFKEPESVELNDEEKLLKEKILYVLFLNLFLFLNFLLS